MVKGSLKGALISTIGCISFLDSAIGLSDNLPKECSQAQEILMPSACESVQIASRNELSQKYPNLLETSERPENLKILCPFLRTLERAGLFDDGKATTSLSIPVYKLGLAAREFLCGFAECEGVAKATSFGQSKTIGTDFGMVDLEKLHKAEGIAHECGFTFGFRENQVNPVVRQKTLANLAKIASQNQGRLVFDDLWRVKSDICKIQNVEMSEPGKVEVKLIFAYLGGVERGYVAYSDVEKLFHSELPGYLPHRVMHSKELDSIILPENP